MQCPRCRAEILPGNAFCHRCRQRLQPLAAEPRVASAAAPVLRRAPHGRRWVWWSSGALLLILVAAGGLALAEWLRLRVTASESAALRDLRAVVVAELRYSQANAGYYDRLECLAAPERCIPGYRAGAPALLDAPRFGAETRGDYRYVFHPGPSPARGTYDPSRISPSSVAAFAYVATPSTERARWRSFCTDASGRLCVLTAADAPELAHGVCPLACLDLRLTHAR